MENKPEINIQMLAMWEKDQWFCYAQNHDSKKKILKFFLKNPSGVYRVRVKDKVIYEGTDRSKAVETYNNL